MYMYLPPVLSLSSDLLVGFVTQSETLMNQQTVLLLLPVLHITSYSVYPI